MVVDDAADAFLERGTTEIDEKAHGLAGQAKIGQQLFAMSRVQPFDGFDFQQQTAIDQQIDTKGRSEEHTSELQSLMRNSHAVLCLKKKNTHKNTNNTAK